MPTVSASQALRDLGSQKTSRRKQLLTGLPSLDDVFSSFTRHVEKVAPDDGNSHCDRGGGIDGDAAELPWRCAQGVVCRGQITEVYGPPGVGKTTLA